MEWSDAKMLQLIELYEKRPYLCDKVAACNWTIAAYATLSHDFVAQLHDKIARENCTCDIDLMMSNVVVFLVAWRTSGQNISVCLCSAENWWKYQRCHFGLARRLYSCKCWYDDVLKHSALIPV